MGNKERRSMVMTSKEKNLQLIEAGHALVGIYTPGNDPLHKVTIIPRSRCIRCNNEPSERMVLQTKTEMKAKLTMMFGEELQKK